MKLSKNIWMIIAVIGVIILIYWLMTKNKKGEINKESGFDATKGATKSGSSGSSGSRLVFDRMKLWGCASGQVACTCTGGFASDTCTQSDSGDRCCSESGGVLRFVGMRAGYTQA